MRFLVVTGLKRCLTGGGAGPLSRLKKIMRKSIEYLERLIEEKSRMRKQYLDEIQELKELKKEAHTMDGIMAAQLYAFYDMRLQHFQWELGLKDKKLEELQRLYEAVIKTD